MPVDTHEPRIDRWLLPDNASNTVSCPPDIRPFLFWLHTAGAGVGRRWPRDAGDRRRYEDGARRRRERLRHAGDRVARTLSVGQQNHRRKCRKCRKPPILRKQRPFRPCRETAEIGGNWRKPPADTLVGNPSALLLSHPRGALQLSMPTSLAQIAETPRSGRQRHRACSAAIVPP
jgi:hypothetical protein